MQSSNQSITLEFSFDHEENSAPLFDYLTTVLDLEVVDIGGEYVTTLGDVETAKKVLGRILQDYESIGMEIENEEFDIFDMIVYSSSPKLQNWYMTRRMSITQTHIEAFSDILAHVQESSESSYELVQQIDAHNTLNGLYKFREIINIFSDELDTLGGYSAEKINSSFVDNIH